MAESKEKLKSFLMRVKEENEKACSILIVKKKTIMASSLFSIKRWQIEREKVEAVTDFLFLGCKITADGDCSHDIRRRLLLGRKAMINLDSALKSKDITFPTKACIVKGMAFSFVMYRCESWTIKKAECWRINAFELWCWRRLLRVPLTARRSNWSILREINPEYSLEGLRLKLKLEYFGHLMQTANSLEKILMLGAEREEDNRGWDGWMASLIQWIWTWANLGDGERQGSLECCSPWGHESDTTWWLNNNNEKFSLTSEGLTLSCLVYP